MADDEALITVALRADEWYPVWSLSTKAEEVEAASEMVEDFPTQYAVTQVSQDLYDRYRQAMRQFTQIQDELATLHETAHPRPEPPRHSFGVVRGFTAEDTDGKRYMVTTGMSVGCDDPIPQWLLDAEERGDVRRG